MNIVEYEKKFVIILNTNGSVIRGGIMNIEEIIVELNNYTTPIDKEINKDLYDIRIYKIEDKVVGYSVIEHNSSFENNGYIYLIRKSLIDYRNLCLYIDYDTFREKLNYENNIIVNWGCSSGGVKKYKLSKFKLAYIKKLYFYNLNKKQS